MNIEKILEEIDVLYSQQKVEEVEALLREKITQLKGENQLYPAISFLNELLGIYREKGDKEKGVACCEELLDIFQGNHFPQDENYGTTLLNIATAHRSFGNLTQSGNYYRQCMAIYADKVDPFDYRYASLYNNLSLLSSEEGNFDQSISYLEKSLHILEQHKEVEVQKATAHTSLAQIHLQREEISTAQEHISLALSLFQGIEDYHFSATLATAAQISFLQGKYAESVGLYQDAMEEIEKYLGQTENYKMLEENMREVQSYLTPETSSIEENAPPLNGMELARAFYEEQGASMIQRLFPDYENYIAVGLVGAGSECFGFDDAYSRDHDFGAGFCIWLPHWLYQKIGVQLEEAYQSLPQTFRNVTRIHSGVEKRVGVFSIDAFYLDTLAVPRYPATVGEWSQITDAALAQATNGAVFRDDLGVFTALRQLLREGYPHQVRCGKMAEMAHLVSQTGQYNLQRCIQRGDYVTASLAYASFVEHSLDLMCLYSGTFAPFYKWKLSTIEKIPYHSHFVRELQHMAGLAMDDEGLFTRIEGVVADLIRELKVQGYIPKEKEGNFLDSFVEDMLKKGETPPPEEQESMVSQIVTLEWNAFDKVQGMEGRAVCQDDFETFQIMRSGQFRAWTVELCTSYRLDFLHALQENRNPISEKYGYMMVSTDPKAYKEIEPCLPPISKEKKAFIERIVQTQLALLLQLQDRYPCFVHQGRSIHTSEDSVFNTSYETYLRGELCTYGNRTLELYYQLLLSRTEQGENLVKTYMENVATQYGYPDLETAEATLSSPES